MSAIFSTSESEYVYIGIGVEAGLEKFETFAQNFVLQYNTGHVNTLIWVPGGSGG